MTIQNWLEYAADTLKDTATPRLDALVLLADLFDKDKSWLLAHPEHEMTTQLERILQEQIQRRAGHEPLAYIRGKSEFYGREFIVSADTLQPRPETETMIDLLHKVIDNENLTSGGLTIVDVGTGSGCLAITAKLEFPSATVCATEISADALRIAKKNTQKLAADITFYLGDLLQPLANPQASIPNPQSPIPCPLLPSLLIILANLPYVPDSHTINKAAMQEPKLAIFGGEDGLDLYRGLSSQLGSIQPKPQYILTEALPTQHEGLQDILAISGYKQVSDEDFIQVFTARSNP